MKNLKSTGQFNVAEKAWGKTGFALIELLLSVSILALVVVIVSVAMRLAYNSIDKGERKMEALGRFRASLNIMDSQVQSQVPLTWDDKGEKKYFFNGDKSSMRFCSNYSLWGGLKGYVEVSYHTEKDYVGKVFLIVSENAVGMEDTRAAKLLEGYDDIRFEYFFKDPTEEAGKWEDTWEEKDDIPEKIRLTIVEGARSLPIIIPMRAKGTLKPLFGDITVKSAGT